MKSWLLPTYNWIQNDTEPQMGKQSNHGMPCLFGNYLPLAHWDDTLRPTCSVDLQWSRLPSAYHALLTKTERWLRLSRLNGRVTLSKLWLNKLPNVKVRRLLGRDTCSRLWLNAKPKVKVWRLLGRVTLSKLWLNKLPNVSEDRLAGVPGSGKMQDCLAGSLCPSSG